MDSNAVVKLHEQMTKSVSKCDVKFIKWSSICISVKLLNAHLYFIAHWKHIMKTACYNKWRTSPKKFHLDRTFPSEIFPHSYQPDLAQWEIINCLLGLLKGFAQHSLLFIKAISPYIPQLKRFEEIWQHLFLQENPVYC